MNINAASISMAAGATVDLTGGGDVYAYEFVPGTGGSRDVLSRTSTAQYSSDIGYQYPDAAAGLRDRPRSFQSGRRL